MERISIPLNTILKVFINPVGLSDIKIKPILSPMSSFCYDVGDNFWTFHNFSDRLRHNFEFLRICCRIRTVIRPLDKFIGNKTL